MNTQPETMPSWWQSGEDAWNTLQEKVLKESVKEDSIKEIEKVFESVEPCANTIKWGEKTNFGAQPILGDSTQGFIARAKKAQPEFARWNGMITLENYKNNPDYNRDGYKCFPSYDWRPLNANKYHPGQQAYDEANGLSILLNWIFKVPLQDYVLFSIFGAYTYGLCEVRKKPHKKPICTIAGGECESFPLLIFDDFYKEKVVVDVYGKERVQLIKQRKLNLKETLLREADGLQDWKRIEWINKRLQENHKLSKMNAA